MRLAEVWQMGDEKKEVRTTQLHLSLMRLVLVCSRAQTVPQSGYQREHSAPLGALEAASISDIPA